MTTFQCKIQKENKIYTTTVCDTRQGRRRTIKQRLKEYDREIKMERIISIDQILIKKMTKCDMEGGE